MGSEDVKKDLKIAIGRVEEHNRSQDAKLSEILTEIKTVKQDIAKSAEAAIHNEYALKAIHRRVDELEEDVKKNKEEIKEINKKLQGNVTWPSVVAIICKAGAFFGGLTVIGMFLEKIILK